MTAPRGAGVDHRLVAIAAIAQAAFIGGVAVLAGLGNPWLAFLGIPAGFGVGLLTRPNGPALRHGLYVAGLGLPLAVVLAMAYGFALSVSMGLGHDSVLSFELSIRAGALAAVVGPFHAITGAIAADRGNVVRGWIADDALNIR